MVADREEIKELKKIMPRAPKTWPWQRSERPKTRAKMLKTRSNLATRGPTEPRRHEFLGKTWRKGARSPFRSLHGAGRHLRNGPVIRRGVLEEPHMDLLRPRLLSGGRVS